MMSKLKEVKFKAKKLIYRFKQFRNSLSSWERNFDPSNPSTLIVGASRYKNFKKRLLTRQNESLFYKKINNELEEFIRLCPWESLALFNLAKLAKTGIVEIGRFNGGSSFLLSLANSTTNIFSIDIAPQDDERFNRILNKANCGKNIKLLVGDANDICSKFDKPGFEYDFLFIDGDHSFEGCSNDIKNWYPNLLPGGIVVFHDAYYEDVNHAIFDYFRNTDAQFLIPPSLTERHWENQYGSLCVLRKPVHT